MLHSLQTNDQWRDSVIGQWKRAMNQKDTVIATLQTQYNKLHADQEASELSTNRTISQLQADKARLESNLKAYHHEKNNIVDQGRRIINQRNSAIQTLRTQCDNLKASKDASELTANATIRQLQTEKAGLESTLDHRTCEFSSSSREMNTRISTLETNVSKLHDDGEVILAEKRALEEDKKELSNKLGVEESKAEGLRKGREALVHQIEELNDEAEHSDEEKANLRSSLKDLITKNRDLEEKAVRFEGWTAIGVESESQFLRDHIAELQAKNRVLEGEKKSMARRIKGFEERERDIAAPRAAVDHPGIQRLAKALETTKSQLEDSRGAEKEAQEASTRLEQANNVLHGRFESLAAAQNSQQENHARAIAALNTELDQRRVTIGVMAKQLSDAQEENARQKAEHQELDFDVKNLLRDSIIKARMGVLRAGVKEECRETE